MNVSRLVLVGIVLLAWSRSTSAAPIYWDPAVGGNGHYYDRIDVANLTWHQANTMANGLTFNNLPGHLVTITSTAEQTFLASNITLPTNRLVWLGGYQDTAAPDYSEPGGGWRWVTRDPFAYTNWNQSANPNNNQPNNHNGDPEHYLQTYNDITPWKWNDVSDNPPAGFKPAAFIVEFEPAAVPEPSTLCLLGFGGMGLAGYAWRKRKQLAA